MLTSLFIFSQYANAADIKAGKEASTQCEGCHGINGDSQSSLFPKLVGQKGLYLEAQLKKFKSGARSNSMMKGVASNLTKQNIENVAAFYASLTSKKGVAGDSTLAKKGEAKVAMCQGCHGSSFEGRGVMPKLAGQHPDYIKKQLVNFKSKARKGEPMNSMTSSLSEEDINEISAYLGGL
ncbi:MAG: cytochrome c4 [Methylococcales bacterium]|nr:cytochrome c4 [Methylococcales bacterium]